MGPGEWLWGQQLMGPGSGLPWGRVWLLMFWPRSLWWRNLSVSVKVTIVMRILLHKFLTKAAHHNHKSDGILYNQEGEARGAQTLLEYLRHQIVNCLYCIISHRPDVQLLHVPVFPANIALQLAQVWFGMDRCKLPGPSQASAYHAERQLWCSAREGKLGTDQWCNSLQQMWGVSIRDSPAL